MTEPVRVVNAAAAAPLPAAHADVPGRRRPGGATGRWFAALREREDALFWTRAGATALSRASLLVLGLVGAIVTARALGPGGRGVFALMLTVGAVGVQLGNLGLPAASAYFVARDAARLPALLGVALAGGVGAGALALGLWLVGAAVPGLSPLSTGLLGLAVAWIPFGILLLLLQNLLLGLREIRLYNLTQLAQDAAAVALMVVLFGAGLATARTLYLSSFAVLVVGTMGVLLLVLRRAGYRVERPAAELWRAAGGYGGRAYLATLFSFLVLQFDLLMVGRMLGAEAAGHYSIAARMAEMLYMFPVAAGTVLFATVSALPSGGWAFARRATSTGAVLMLPVLALAGALAEPVVRILFGEAFLPAVPAFLWLLPGVYALSVNTLLMNYFAGTGMPLVTVLSPGAAAAVNVALNLWLLPRLGIVGAAVASTIAYTLMLVFSGMYLRKGGRT